MLSVLHVNRQAYHHHFTDEGPEVQWGEGTIHPCLISALQHSFDHPSLLSTYGVLGAVLVIVGRADNLLELAFRGLPSGMWAFPCQLQESRRPGGLHPTRS